MIVQGSRDAQIGYQRILPHAAAPIYTRFDVSTVLSVCRRCASRPEKRKRKYLRVLRLYRIFRSSLWYEVFIKSSPDPKANPICASIHPGYRTTTSDPVLIYTDASFEREICLFVRLLIVFFLEGDIYWKKSILQFV